MLKLIIDYEPADYYYNDYELGSVFYFNTLEEIFDFISIAAKNTYHTYYIEDLKQNENQNNTSEEREKNE